MVTPELWQEIYNSYFSGHLVQLSSHPIANFIVQHLMASTTEKSQVGNNDLFVILYHLEETLALLNQLKAKIKTIVISYIGGF